MNECCKKWMAAHEVNIHDGSFRPSTMGTTDRYLEDIKFCPECGTKIERSLKQLRGYYNYHESTCCHNCILQPECDLTNSEYGLCDKYRDNSKRED